MNFGSDHLTQVGAINWPPNDKPAWSWDTDHTPSPFYPAYILTGDPWYLDEMFTWVAVAAATPNYSGGRGPTGAYGGFSGSVRAEAWTARNRAEAAFAAPDAAPEKAFFTYLTNDMLALWEGSSELLAHHMMVRR